MEEKKKSSKGFWIVFGLCIVFAAISTLGNLLEYRKMDKLNSEGRRILVPVDSVSNNNSSKHEIFVKFSVNGQEYSATKKIKSTVAVGDSVPVYYLPQNPATNGIPLE
ncbi:MAG: hypothetical protein U0T74_05150 [Chitinophagales bacterium]